jgi:hypothetical protein
MNEDAIVQSIWYVGVFALVLSALIARRLPLKDSLKMALIWVAIFGFIYLILSWWQAMG